MIRRRQYFKIWKIKYVQLKSKPIGIINANDIQFVRPGTGSFDSITIIVFLENQIGILIEEEGESTVKIAQLPEKIQELYENAGINIVKKDNILYNEDKELVIILDTQLGFDSVPTNIRGKSSKLNILGFKV